MNSAPDPAIQAALRLALALLFAGAAWHKLRDWQGFRAALDGYALLPGRAVVPVARALPALEVAAALSLAWPIASVGAALGGGLLLLYSFAVGVNLLRGRRAIDCGCGGPAAERGLGTDLLVRNAVLLAAVCVSALAPSSRVLVWIDGVTIAGGVVTFALLYAAMETALANRHALQDARSLA